MNGGLINMNLEKLIGACRLQNRKAFFDVFELYKDRMFLVCKRYVKNTSVAEELLSDGFFRFFEAIHKFEYRSESATEAWLKKIMVNVCLGYLRSNKVFNLVPILNEEIITMQEEIIERISEKEILLLILELPTSLRTVFNLFELENMSHAEIAKELGITEQASRLQLYRAKGKIKEMLIQNNGDYEARKNG